MKIALIGGVRSTQVVLAKLIEFGFKDVFVYGYKPSNVELVSSWVDLQQAARHAGFSFLSFRKVTECSCSLKHFSPDLVFAVGLSQLIPRDMLDIPPLGFIGFHPTHLPLGRGKTPLAWLILEQMNGAATFFLIQEGVDDGPILSQVPYSVNDVDDATSVEEKMLTAECQALDVLLPNLLSDSLNPTNQDDRLSTYYGKRSPLDGWIDWSSDTQTILRLIKATTSPHPGAYTFERDNKIKILRAKLFDPCYIKGVVGRILDFSNDQGISVQCGNGVISITEWSAPAGWKQLLA